MHNDRRFLFVALLAMMACGMKEDDVDPDAFIRWTYAQALAHRQPRYEAMSRWGGTVTADQVAGLKSEDDFNDLIAGTLSA